MTASRLLAGAWDGPLDAPAHRAIHGELPVVPPRILLDELRRVRLCGRGGGGFPLARKIEAVMRGRTQPVLVVNGCEGDPLSEKDRVLLAHAPHLVIDGAIHLARTIEAREIHFAIDDGTPHAEDALRHALARRPELTEGRRSATVLAVPAGYVSGQESALARFTRDGVALPLTVPPRVTERGVGRRPTLVSNVETVAQVAVLASLGAGEFASLGTNEQPGTTLVTLTGAVGRPGVHEVAFGTSLAALVAEAGGLTDALEAVLVGGCAGTWISAADARGLTLSDAALRPLGGRIGLAAIVVLPRSACPTAEVARASAWLARRSAGQCGPCVLGLAAIADALAAVRDGRGEASALRDVEGWAASVIGRGACAHPDGTAQFVSSALRTFADDLADHAWRGRCDACAMPSVLALEDDPAPPLVAP